MRCLIVSGGTPPSEEIFKEELQLSELLIAADKGAETFYHNNIKPHYVLGDFDSINTKTLEFLADCNIIPFNPEKDFTDSELAVNKAIELGAKELVLLGFTGTRIDHTIANIGLLKRCLEHNIKAYIRDCYNKIMVVNKKTTLVGKSGQIISFQALDGNVENFSIRGAKYELEGYRLSFGDPLTVSNEFCSNPITIDFDNGNVLVIFSKD